MLTQQQKNIKKMITDLRLKHDTTITGSIYIEKNKKIKDNTRRNILSITI